MVYFCFMTHLHRPLHLKKSLGQHFLKDEFVCQSVVNALKQNKFSQLLEIGPGAGALTKYLIDMTGVDFKAVEIDREKILFLKKKYPVLENRIIELDFLQMEKPFDGSFTIIGNFPYNISTEILFKILTWREDVETVIGMFQKEVALRIAASEGKRVYGVTSVLLQAFFDVEYLCEVYEQSCHPPTKEKSAVIRLTTKKEAIHMK